MSLQIHHPRQSLHGAINHQTHVNAEMLSKGNARTWTSHNSPNKADQDDWNEGVYDQEEYTFADEINMPCACISMNGTIVDVNETFCNLVGENDLHNIVNRKTILDYCYAEDLNHNLSVLQTLVYGESDLDNGSETSSPSSTCSRYGKWNVHGEYQRNVKCICDFGLITTDKHATFHRL